MDAVITTRNFFIIGKPALLSLTATPVPSPTGIQLRPPPASLSPSTQKSPVSGENAREKPRIPPTAKSGNILAPTYLTPPSNKR